MKILFLFIFIISNIFAIPSWYYKLSNTKSNYIIGYGSGADEKEAKQNAFNDISSQISVKVDNKIIQNKKIVNGKYSRNNTQIATQQTNATLSGYKTLKLEYHDNQYFIALEYENIPNIQKFKNKLKAENIEVNFDNYLKTFDLIRLNKKWYIKYKNIQQILDKKDFAKFFVTIPNKNLMLNINKKNNILYDKDEFYFRVKSTKSGFLSILTVYEDGTVSTLIKNIKISKNRVENIPDKDFEGVLEAGLINPKEETYELYIAIISDKKLLFDNFTNANMDLITSEKSKNFDELIKFIKNKEYATLKVITKPR